MEDFFNHEEADVLRAVARSKKVCSACSCMMKLLLIILCSWWIVSSSVMALSLVNPGAFQYYDTVSWLSISIYFVAIVPICSIFLILNKIFIEVARGCSPFTLKQVKRLRIVSLSFLVYVGIEFLFTSSTLLIQQSWSTVLSSGSVPNVNMFALVASAVIYAFSYVFEYGVLLQEFSDETL